MIDFQTPVDSTNEIRAKLKSREEVQFVDRNAFCNLLISGRKLIRCDFPDVRVKGLFDDKSGKKYLIEKERLFADSNAV